MAFVEPKPITYGTASADFINGGINGTTPSAGLLPSTAAGAGYREYGLGGNDTLWGAGAADTLVGGDGNDQLRGGLGADQLYGQAGNDSFLFYNKAGVGDDLGVKDNSTWLGSGGDIVMDFSSPQGHTVAAGGQDHLSFSGFGTAAHGATVVFDHWGTAADNSVSSFGLYKVYAGTDAVNGMAGHYNWLAVQTFDHSQTKLVAGEYLFNL